MVQIRVDNQIMNVDQGSNLLGACLGNNIYIPHLCFLADMGTPSASCRLCFVAIEGLEVPVTACTVTIKAPLVVHTDTPQVRRLQRTALKLLLSMHHVGCKPCPANRNCELQRLAKFLGIGLTAKPLVQFVETSVIDNTHPFIAYHVHRCVLCGKCVRVCRRNSDQPTLTFAGRGFETTISTFGAENQSANHAEIPCAGCAACISACPVGALTAKDP